MRVPSPIVLVVLLLATGAALAESPWRKDLFLASLGAVLVVAAARLVLRWLPGRLHIRRVLTPFARGIVFSVVMLFLFGTMLATQPRLRTTYSPDRLANADGIVDYRGFYPLESDPAGNRFVWTQDRATIVVDFLVKRPVTLTFDMRSAAVAGGPDAPVEVRVNGQVAGVLRPDPRNPAFQTLNLRLVPYNWGGQQTEIKLLPATFKPRGDTRMLGTMVRSVTIDKTEAWSPIRRWMILLWLLPAFAVLAAGCIWVHQRRAVRWAGYAAVALDGIGALDAVIAFVLLLRVGTIAPRTSTVWTLASGAITLIFSTAALSTPIGWPNARTAGERLRAWLVSRHIRERLHAGIDSLTGAPEAAPIETRRAIRRDLLLLFGFALGIRLLWVAITPPWQSPDENAHFAYIQHIVEQREIPAPSTAPYPDYSNEEVNSWTLTLLGELSGVGATLAHNLPYLPVSYDYPAARDFQAAGALRWTQAGGAATPYPAFYYLFGAIPYAIFTHSPILSRLYAIRCETALWGALSCVVAYLIAYELRRTRRWGWALGLAMALMPMYVFVTATVNNDAAMDLLATILIWLVVRTIQQERFSLRLALAVGITIGFALQTKPAIMPVVLVAGLVVCGKWIAAIRPSWRDARVATTMLGACVGSAFVVYAPWMFFRLRHYGVAGFVTVPIAPIVRLLLGVTPMSAAPPALSGSWTPIGVGSLSLPAYLLHEQSLGWGYFYNLFFRIFWADFGWLDAPLQERVYLPIVAAYAICGIGLLIQIAIQPARRRSLLLLIGVVLAETVFLFGADWYEGFLHTGGTLGLQGRYWFPVLAPLLFLLLSGWDHLWRERPAGLRLALIGFLALHLISLAAMLDRYYGVTIG